MKNVKMGDKEKIYIVYDWASDEVKRVSYNSDKAYAKFGEDFLYGDVIENYKLIEINLNEVEE